MRVATPIYLVLLLLIPLLIIRFKRLNNKKSATLLYPEIRLLKTIAPSRKIRFKSLPQILRLALLTLLIFAMSRPQAGIRDEEIKTEGIDIMMVLDISSSMSTSDLKPNRLEVAKKVMEKFIMERHNDRIGLVLFAGSSFTQCPLTLDYQVLTSFLKDVHIGMIEDGTAIGMALVNALNRLKASNAKSKIIILVTDGVNNRGKIDPQTAGNLAKATGIKVYTIGVGKEGRFLQDIDDPIFGKRKVQVITKIDEDLLKVIANLTNAAYYRATDEESLADIYKEINKLEKTEIKTKVFFRYRELFIYFLLPGLILLLIEIILSHTIFRKIP